MSWLGLTLGHACSPTNFSYLLGIHLSQWIFSLPTVLWYKFGWAKLWRIALDLPNLPKFSPTTILCCTVYRITGISGDRKFSKQAKFTCWWKLNLVVKLWLNLVTFNMATQEANSYVRGVHVYSDIWTPFVGETLACELESGNLNDPYMIAIKKGRKVVRHVLRKSSTAWSLFLLLGGTICCEITDNESTMLLAMHRFFEVGYETLTTALLASSL